MNSSRLLSFKSTTSGISFILKIVFQIESLILISPSKIFASTVLLYNDVPMEIVSELLGHSNMIITQESYGKVVQKKISQAMLKLRVKLK